MIEFKDVTKVYEGTVASISWIWPCKAEKSSVWLVTMAPVFHTIVIGQRHQSWQWTDFFGRWKELSTIAWNQEKNQPCIDSPDLFLRLTANEFWELVATYDMTNVLKSKSWDWEICPIFSTLSLTVWGHWFIFLLDEAKVQEAFCLTRIFGYWMSCWLNLWSAGSLWPLQMMRQHADKSEYCSLFQPMSWSGRAALW